MSSLLHRLSPRRSSGCLRRLRRCLCVIRKFPTLFSFCSVTDSSRRSSSDIPKSTLIASVTVSVLVPLLLLLIFFFVRRRRRVRFELVPPTVTTMRNEDEPVSIPPDTQPRPLPVPPRATATMAHAPRPSSMQKDASLFVDTDMAAEQQSPPSAGVVGDLERSSSTGATAASVPEPALPARPNPPPFPPPYTPATPVTGMTSTSQESQLPPYLASESRAA